jgi:hypothetical protein
MLEFCTCGAQLPPDSLFCHKCGKPQREIVALEPEPARPVELVPPPAAPAAPVAGEPQPVNFHNLAAIKVAFLMAFLAMLLSFLPYVNWLAAGFFAALMYRRRTGHFLNLESGLRLGWMTGILMFAIIVVAFTALMVLISAAGGVSGLPAEVRASVDPRMQEMVNEMVKTVRSVPAMAQMLALLFVFTTLLGMAGGALGAKFVSRNQ